MNQEGEHPASPLSDNGCVEASFTFTDDSVRSDHGEHGPSFIDGFRDRHRRTSDASQASTLSAPPDEASGSSTEDERRERPASPRYGRVDSSTCPLTRLPLADPIVTPDGHLYERRAILRWLVLSPTDPLTGSELGVEDLAEFDFAGREDGADGSRRDGCGDEDGEGADGTADGDGGSHVELDESRNFDGGGADDRWNLVSVDTSSSVETHRQQRQPQSQISRSSLNDNLLQSNFAGILPVNDLRAQKSDLSRPKTNNAGHGWNTPLGVHEILSPSPVTTHFHRRSAAVRRVAVGRSLGKKGKKKKGAGSRHKNETGAVAAGEELILPPGSHVQVLETAVHGGRVRGNILWEETPPSDEEAAPQARGGEAFSPKKKNGVFRRKNGARKANPFSADLFADAPHRDRARKAPSPPIPTVKYGGWISLQRAGNGEEGSGADEDEGPWTRPIPLGVYRIGGRPSRSASGLPLSDAADSDGNITHVLADGQCVEIVETRVVVMKAKQSRDPTSSASDAMRGVRTVRARCTFPILIPPTVLEDVDARRCGDARPRRKFESGWISLCTDGDFARNIPPSASPLPLGAYVVSSECAVTEREECDSKVKAVLPRNSCMEVVATRIEFEEKESPTCRCGRESARAAAVRGLVASGGHATLLVFPISRASDGLCSCGESARAAAEPVPLGAYRILRSTEVTSGASGASAAISALDEGALVEVTRTGVEGGCVRGRVTAVDSKKDPVEGWISLFEFSERWAEYVGE